MKALLLFAVQEGVQISIKTQGTMLKVAIGNNKEKVAVETLLDPEKLESMDETDLMNNLKLKYERSRYPERFVKKAEETPKEEE